nr:ribonuclease H-like domain-containing protein [Tanacetum cinerariifolium]
MTPWYKNDNQSGQFWNQRTMNVAGARENVGSPVVQQSGIYCFNCKEFRYFAKECRRPKRVKDFAYHKEKMLLCKQDEQGIDSEPLEQIQNDVGYNVFAIDLQHYEQSEYNDQNDVESDDERVTLANLKLDNKQTGFKKYKAFNDRTVDYDKLERKLNETLGQVAQKDIEIKEGLKTKAYEILVVKEKHDELIKQSLLTKLHYKDLVKQKTKIVQLILFIVDSGCTKHMTGNLKLLCNFIEKFMGTVRFGNDQFALILGYGDLVQGNIMINRVYYVEGLNHNLFLVGQFFDADLEVAFWKSTCFLEIFRKNVVIGVPKLKYVKDQLCSSYELSKVKRSSFKSKAVPSSKGSLNLLHIDLCSPMRVASINGKKYILVIVDDYSRYTWTLFLRSKDETPKEFLTMIQRNLQALVITVRTDRCTDCYITRDGKNLDKMKEKGDLCILVGYSNQSKGYRVYNERTRMIVESIHIRFDEIKEVSKTSVANDTSGLVPQRQKVSDYDNSDPILQL